VSQEATPEVAPIAGGSRIEQLGLIATMFIGSIGMWLGAPALWLWLAGRGSAVSQTAMGSLVLILIGIPVTMIGIGKLLSRVDNRYTARFGRGEALNERARWLHGVRGDGQAPSMLDKIMVASIGLLFLALAVWFVFFSGGSANRPAG
jgi:hypothetical protein